MSSIVRLVKTEITELNIPLDRDDQISAKVPDPDPEVWNPTTEYTENSNLTQVSSPAGGLNNIYVRLQNAEKNVGKNPDEEHERFESPFIATPTNPFWRARRKTNAFSINDSRPTQTTGRSEEITFTVSCEEPVNTFAFFGINATELEISFERPGSEPVSRVAVLSDVDSITNYEDFLTLPVEFTNNYMFRNLPLTSHSSTLPSEQKLRVTIRNPGGIATIGQFVAGHETLLGSTDRSTVSIEHTDFSDIAEDPYGVLQTVPRPSANSMRYVTVFERDRTEYIRQLTSSFGGGVPALFFLGGDGDNSWFGSLIYGYLKQARINYFSESNSAGKVEIQVQGII